MLAAGSGSKNHFAAYNIEAFTDPEQFKDTMDGMLKTLRTAKPVPGQDRVLYPGLSRPKRSSTAAPTGSRCTKRCSSGFAVCTGEMGIAPLAAVR